MSFDDRLRDSLRRAAHEHPLDVDDALTRVKAGRRSAPAPRDADPVPVALVDLDAPRAPRLRARRVGAVAAAIALLGAGVAVPLALRSRPHDTARRRLVPTPAPKHGDHSDRPSPAERHAAIQAVASAVNATTGAGSYRVSYALSETAGTAPTTTTCVAIRTIKPLSLPSSDLAQSCYGPGPTNVTTQGYATVNTNPFAMTTASNVSTFGNVTVQVDADDYWENPGVGDVPGSPLSGFAGLVESTLGPREGAGAMMGLASPSGYLSITKAAITDAARIGTDTVNGEPVTVYRVAVDPSRLADVAGLSTEEAKTIADALSVLRGQGFTGNTTDVSVDAQGYVVHTVSVNHFADGGAVTSVDTFSAFGCAGAVQLPGRPAATSTGTCAGTTAPTTLPGTAPASASRLQG